MDELPWIAKASGTFLGALDYCWNRYFSRSECGSVLLIVCGSTASWIIQNIIINKGGLHNRVTQVMWLLPFSLGEARDYLSYRNIQLDDKQIIELYMTLGGVPLYLSFVGRGMSSAQAINALCFGKNAFLQDEFERIYASLFDNHHNHVRLIRALAKVKRGLHRNKLLEEADVPNGGDTTMYLKELESAGFNHIYPAWNKK
jgi:hypothetical protein